MAGKEIIDALDNDNTVDATALFQQALADKIMQKLELRKPEIAKDWLNNLSNEDLPTETETKGE